MIRFKVKGDYDVKAKYHNALVGSPGYIDCEIAICDDDEDPDSFYLIVGNRNNNDLYVTIAEKEMNMEIRPDEEILREIKDHIQEEILKTTYHFNKSKKLDIIAQAHHYISNYVSPYRIKFINFNLNYITDALVETLHESHIFIFDSSLQVSQDGALYRHIKCHNGDFPVIFIGKHISETDNVVIESMDVTHYTVMKGEE